MRYHHAFLPGIYIAIILDGGGGQEMLHPMSTNHAPLLNSPYVVLI